MQQTIGIILFVIGIICVAINEGLNCEVNLINILLVVGILMGLILGIALILVELPK